MQRVFKTIIVGIAAVSAASACSDIMKEQSGQEPFDLTVIEVRTSSPEDSLSKTGISASEQGRRHTLWSAGDRLALEGIASEPLDAKYAGTSKASFIWNSTLTDGNLLYPSSFWKDETTVTLPYSQNKMPGEDNIATDCCPMCGKAVSRAATLNHLCAILKIKWVQKSTTQQAPDICYLEFRGKNSEQVSGDFSIDYSTAKLTGASSAPESRYVRAYSMKKVEADTSVCNIVVPAGTYSKGFFVRIVDKSGYYMEVYTSKSKTLAAGTIVAMPCFKYNPSTKLTALAPSSAGELIAIAKEWNSGRYEGGVANISLASDIQFSSEQSLEWAEIGGLGTSDVPYKGTFDGKGFAVKGLISTTPLLGYVAAGSVITNITTDSSCNFKGSHAALVGVLAGKISNCTNEAPVSFCPALKTTSNLGGLVSEAKSGAAIENCTNNALIHLDALKMTGCVSGSADNPIVSMGGILGYATGSITVKDCSNAGKIFCDYSTDAKINLRPSWIGGIVGRIDGGGSIISGCNDTGAIFNTNWNNSDNLSGPVSGCIVGVVDGAASSSVSIIGCKVLGSDQLQTQRGIQGGIVGYAKNAVISNSCFSKATVPCSYNIPAFSGGICAKAYSCTISGCTAEYSFQGTKTTVATAVGGICGWMSSDSKVIDNTVTRIKLARNGTTGWTFGAVVGDVESSSSEISGNKYSGSYSTDSGSSYSLFGTGNVCGASAFTVTTPNTLDDTPYNLSGTVTCGSEPLAGVVVTDGYSCVQTDVSGSYYLNARDSATCVSISIPSGYMCATTSGVPAFYRKLSTVSASSGIKTVNFSCNRLSNPDKYTVLMYADIQIRPTSGDYSYYDTFAFRSIAVAKDVFSDLADRAAGVSDGSNVIGISLGDQIHKSQHLIGDTYTKSDMLGKLSFPNFSVPGNHDYNPAKTEYIPALAEFETYLAPARYSFNIGKFHVVMIDNARTKYVASAKSEKTENKGLSDSSWEWLQNDLKLVPTTTPIIICSHRPLFLELYYDTSGSRVRDISTRSWAINTAYAGLLAQYKKVYAFNGDLHTTYNGIYTSGEKKNIECHSIARSTGELWTNQFVNSCGTPRGYLELKINGENVTYKFKPVAYQTASCYSSPSPMTYRDFSVTNSKFTMKSTYLSKPGAVLDDFYQIHAYAPGVSTQFPDDVIANVFMYDPRWSTVTFEYDGGSIDMQQIPVDAEFHDPTYTWIHSYYKSSTGLKSEPDYQNTHPCYNCFRCTPPSGVNAGTVRVSDHFGNNYEYKFAW